MFKKSKPASEAPSLAQASGRKLDVNRPVSKATSIIGPAVEFKGELRADEDLVIEGKIEGTIAHHKKSLTVGSQGRVIANISARSLVVRGTVEGDVRCEESVVLAKGSHVTGDIVAPRIRVEDGACVQGRIETREHRETAPVGANEPQAVGAAPP